MAKKMIKLSKKSKELRRQRQFSTYYLDKMIEYFEYMLKVAQGKIKYDEEEADWYEGLGQALNEDEEDWFTEKDWQDYDKLIDDQILDFEGYRNGFGRKEYFNIKSWGKKYSIKLLKRYIGLYKAQQL